jgi:stearoyl-CoA desaturase (delta-9 desaturase)
MFSIVTRRRIDVVSLALFAGMHAACALVFFVPFSFEVLALALGSYVVRMFAITAGYHRYLAHRAFKTSRLFQFLLAAVGTASMQNGPLWWASWHRHHHKHSDAENDAHSPRHGGFWHAHLGWVFDGKHDQPDFSNVKDLTRYPELRFLERHKWVPLVAWALACFAIAGWAGVVWGFVLATIALFHATCFINSLAHVWGKRRYRTGDDSRNNLALAVLTLGEGWHNNHHHYMSSARQGFFWWEVDASYYAIKILSWVRVVWDVRAPSAEAIRPPPCAADEGALG